MRAGISLDDLTLREHVDLANVLLLDGATLAERDYIEARLSLGLPGLPGVDELPPAPDEPVTPTRSRWAVSEDEWGLDLEAQAALDAAAARSRPEGTA